MTHLSHDQIGSRDGNYNMVRILAKQHKGFGICHINAQSLSNKIDEFRFLFENSGVDAICISETWLNDDVNDSIYDLNGYRIFRSDRGAKAGGVAIYIRNNISCKLNCKYNAVKDVEYVFVDINYHGEKLLLGCVYRSHKAIKYDNLFTKLELLSVAYPDVIIAGDFNSNLLTETDLSTPMSSFSLSAVNTTRPTHFTSTSSTLLDLFFVSDNTKVLHYDQLAAPAFSKHDLIFLSFNYSVLNQSQMFSFRDFNNINSLALAHDLDNVPWEQIFYLSTASEQLRFLNDHILQTYNKHVPIKFKTVSNKERPWFTNDAKLLIERRDNLYHRWKRYKTPEYHNEYCLARKAVVSKIKHDKSSYYTNKFGMATGNSKKTWKQIREIGIVNKTIRTNDVDVDTLNETFVNIPQPTVQHDFYDQHQPLDPNITQFDVQCFNQLDVLEGFHAVKSNAVGLDDMNPRFLKIILPWIIRFVTHLFNTIVTTSTFPHEWKHAKIVPVPKTALEYRPIAILSYLSKVFEHLLHKQIYNYVNHNNLLTDRQSGFRPKHSCITALSDVTEEIRGNLDDGKITFLVLLDHSKAFDTVHHSTLCLKLSKMFNFSPTAVKLISSYLTNRSQSVSNGVSISKSLPVVRGVPQGSILGPLLYSLYANDLPQQLQYCNIQMYADDVQLYLSSNKASIRNKVQELNDDLNKIFTWATANGLRLNPRKSKCIIIAKKSIVVDEINIFLGDSKIDVVNTVRNLGIVFNKTLTWSDHIHISCGRTYSMLRSLWITQYFTPPKIRMLLAKTYLVPTLLYSSELFTGCNARDMKKLNTTFNNITRYIFGLGKFDHVSEYSSRIFGISLDNYLKIKNLVFLHKIIMTKAPNYLYERLEFTRSSRTNDIIQIRHRDTASERQFFILTIRLWNQLSNNMQNTSNAIKFKKLLMQYFS